MLSSGWIDARNRLRSVSESIFADACCVTCFGRGVRRPPACVASGTSSSGEQVAGPVEDRARLLAVGRRPRRGPVARRQHDRDHRDVVEVAERVQRELERLAHQQPPVAARRLAGVALPFGAEAVRARTAARGPSSTRARRPSAAPRRRAASPPNSKRAAADRRQLVAGVELVLARDVRGDVLAAPASIRDVDGCQPDQFSASGGPLSLPAVAISTPVSADHADARRPRARPTRTRSAPRNGARPGASARSCGARRARRPPRGATVARTSAIESGGGRPAGEGGGIRSPAMSPRRGRRSRACAAPTPSSSDVTSSPYSSPAPISSSATRSVAWRFCSDRLVGDDEPLPEQRRDQRALVAVDQRRARTGCCRARRASGS